MVANSLNVLRLGGEDLQRLAHCVVAAKTEEESEKLWFRDFYSLKKSEKSLAGHHLEPTLPSFSPVN